VKIRSLPITPTLLVVIFLAVPDLRSEANSSRKGTLGLRCIDIVEGLGRIIQPDPARSFQIAREVLSQTSVLLNHPALRRARDMLESLPDGHRSLETGAAVLAAQDNCESMAVGQSMTSQLVSAKFGSLPRGAACPPSLWFFRVQLEILKRRLLECFPVARFDLASVFEKFRQRVNRGLQDGELYVEGFEYRNWQVVFILTRLKGVDTYVALKLPSLKSR
jgi:hypothetical protein